MALESDFLKQLVVTFKNELQDKLQIITDGLFALEKNREEGQSKKIIEEIFRAAHNIKGSARSVGVLHVGDIAHQIESLFASIQSEKITINSDLINLCLLAVDGMRSAMDSFSHNEPLTFDLEELLHNLQEGKPVKIKTIPKNTEPPPETVKIPHENSEYESIRVPLTQIDQVSALIEQMQINKISIEEHFEALRKITNKMKSPLSNETSALLSEGNHLLEKLCKTMHNSINELNTLTNSLQEEVRRLRLVPASTLLRQLTRSVRDLALQMNKKIEFVITGDQVKMDKMILEGLKDPIIHLLRNAIDHGIEDAETRKALGKSKSGQVTIDVLEEGDQILINLSDDGMGIDSKKIASIALRKNILTQSELDSMDNTAICELIFRSEFSTKDIITDISGRGVGLDVVKTNISDLKGEVHFNTEIGKGTCFHLRLPLTLASDIGLTVKSAGQLFVLPTSAIEHVMIASNKEIQEVESSQIILFNQKAIPVTVLSDLLKLEQEEIAAVSQLPLVILKKGKDRIALLVEEIIGERDIVIKPLTSPLISVFCIAGGTLLGTGEVIIVLNPNDLFQAALHSGLNRLALNAESFQEKKIPHILLAEDSITTRTLEKNILESNNYRVTVAVDGKEAWDLLQKHSFSLLITDIEMPNLNGFDLTERVKQDEKLRDLPVIIVTSLGGEEQKKRGIEVGADAYIVKHDFESTELLQIVGQLV